MGEEVWGGGEGMGLGERGKLTGVIKNGGG